MRIKTEINLERYFGIVVCSKGLVIMFGYKNYGFLWGKE